MWDLLLSAPAVYFSIPALAGTALFALRLVLMMLGGHHEGVGHADSPDHAPDSIDGHDGDLHLLSVQGILAFFMGFGWTGLLVLSLNGPQLVVATAAALVVGTVAMYLMARLMSALMKLQSSGNIDPRAAIGTEGTVYVTIPETGHGTGQVTLVINQKQRTYSAVSTAGELARNAKVRVIDVQGPNTLAVSPV
jgi:membrane protein implicated in regulation of membrane protease activity